jgi:hypothetical protein
LDTVKDLLKRQVALKSAMKQPGGARVTEERELQDLNRKLDAMTPAIELASTSNMALRCSLAEFASSASRAANDPTRDPEGIVEAARALLSRKSSKVFNK